MNPTSEYIGRLDRWRSEFSRDQRLSIRLGNWRLIVAIAFALLAYLAFARATFSGWILLAPAAVFIALLVFHDRIARRQQLATRAIVYYERGLTRLDDKWTGAGNPGVDFEDAAHIYSSDLDVFGRGSLFELISVARTAEGERVLANWLLASAPPSEVRQRQTAISELRDDIQLREDIALLGEDTRAGVHAHTLASWGAAPRIHFPAALRVIALLLACYNAAAFLAYMGHLATARPFLGGMVVALLTGAALKKRSRQVAAAVETPASDLKILSLLVARLERERFDSPRLRELRSALDIAGLAASKRISKLTMWMDFLDSADHLAIRVIGPVLLYREQVSMGVEAWRRDNGPHVSVWLAAVAEMEALSSLASIAFERPEWQFPELLESGPVFEAEQLRHPLMNQRRCVPNDVSLGRGAALYIVSGSNMSGKSTLLRAIGLNTVLAWAGAPVAAKRLSVSPLAVGASMRIVDSLQDGRSRFYAEITRLRQIVDLTASDRPAMFLLDELLSGTNSHDRRIGAEAIVRNLVERGAIGLVTTHDLALTQIGNTVGNRAINVHFEDHMEDGRISFDYKMLPGIVERSNALELMRAVGLGV